MAPVIALLVAICGPAYAAAIVHPTPPEPLLTGGKPGPCDPKLGQPDYVAGVNVAGNPVPPADLPAAQTSLPAEILVPLDGKGRHSGEGPVIALDGQALKPLLTPPPGCAAKSR